MDFFFWGREQRHFLCIPSCIQAVVGSMLRRSRLWAWHYSMRCGSVSEELHKLTTMSYGFSNALLLAILYPSSNSIFLLECHTQTCRSPSI